MKALMTLFWRLAIVRARPEETPYSPAILVVVLMMWTALQLVVGLAKGKVSVALFLGSQWLALSVLLGGTLLLLGFKGLTPRWLQTATALVGVDVVLSLINLPLLVLSLSEGPNSVLVQLPSLLLVSWQLAAQAFIFHRSLNVGPFLGLAVSMILLLATFVTIATLLPAALVPAS